MEDSRDQCELRFGLIADVQYADFDDQYNFEKTAKRMYRHARVVLQNAVKEWNEQELDFVVQLGDLVDGCNAQVEDLQRREDAFRCVLDDLSHLKCKTWHIIGNHDLYNFDKTKLSEVFGLQNTYYEFKPKPGWRVICLDGYVESVLDKSDQPAYSIGVEIMNRENPNDWQSKGVNFQVGLEGENLRFVPFNGGLGKIQLDWFRDRLMAAHAEQEKVVVFSHLPLLPDAELEASRYLCLAWDFQEALDILYSTPAQVAAVFAGHDHAGGQGIQVNAKGSKIPHITLLGAVESYDDRCHASVVISEDCNVSMKGFGSLPSWPHEHGDK